MEPVVQPATSQRRRLRMKRFFLVLAVAALLAAMMAVSAVPAFALGKPPGAGPPPVVCERLVIEHDRLIPPCADRT